MMWHHCAEHSGLVTSHHAARLRCQECVLPLLDVLRADCVIPAMKTHPSLLKSKHNTVIFLFGLITAISGSGSLNTLMSKLDVLTRMGVFWLHCVCASQVSGCFLKSSLIPSLTFLRVSWELHDSFALCVVWKWEKKRELTKQDRQRNTKRDSVSHIHTQKGRVRQTERETETCKGMLCQTEMKKRSENRERGTDRKISEAALHEKCFDIRSVIYFT